ncbi:unnamed protein product, partial [Penicillium nalgiovense]
YEPARGVPLWSFVWFWFLISVFSFLFFFFFFFSSQHPSLYRHGSYDCCLFFTVILLCPIIPLFSFSFSFFFRISLWRFNLMRCALFPLSMNFRIWYFLFLFPCLTITYLETIMRTFLNFIYIH